MKGTSQIRFATPTWVLVLNSVLTAWISFFVCFLSLASIGGVLSTSFRTTVPLLGGLWVLFVIIAGALAGAYYITRWVRRRISLKSFGDNVIMLLLLIVMTVLLLPLPFIYVVPNG